MKIRSALIILALIASAPAYAVQLDWTGEFRSEFNFIHDYTLDSGANGNNDATRAAANGYYIPGGGSSNANFQNLFLRLKPKVAVNDNIYIFSEWWLGDPIFGIFGDSVPYTSDQHQFFSTQSRGSVITAQRYWGEFDSDIGVFEIGRAPLDWGLGLVWNRGDGIWGHGSRKTDHPEDKKENYGRPWDRYESTGDQVRLLSRFGSFIFSPAYILYSAGNNVGGACQVTGTPFACNPVPGGGGVADYSVSLKYENLDEDIEGGVNFIRRVGQAANDVYTLGATPVGMAYNTWDIYGKKKLGKFTLAGELPIVNGSLGGGTYDTWAFAGEIDWRVSDSWDTALRLGHAPGQPGSQTPVSPDFKSFFFNPNYKLGLIMFNYQFANFAGPNTLNNPGVPVGALKSPYDNPITNANYINWAGAYHTDKWDFHTNWTFAKANETASASSAFNWNDWSRSYAPNGAGKDQGSWIGWEMDYGATFQWDDNFQFGLDFGLFFPGSFYKYSNTAVDNQTDTVFATMARVGVSF
jgi:hypothetical protein